MTTTTPVELSDGWYWVKREVYSEGSGQWVLGEWEPAEYLSNVDCWYARVWGGIPTREMCEVGPRIVAPADKFNL